MLVVEDEPTICEIFLKVFTGEGYEVEIATNGWEGERKLANKGYDLIMIDMRTPIMDGRQLYQKIKEKYPNIIDKVIMTSGEVMDSDIQKFLEEADIPFLPKPFTSKELKKGLCG